VADFQVLGIAQAVKNLQEMSRAIQTRVTRKAVRSATGLILKAVRGDTYKGDRTRRTGLLLRSLAMTVSTKRRDVIVGKIVMRPVSVTGKSRVAQRVRSSKKAKLGNATEMAAFYWRFLERGTKPRTTKGGANRGAVAASPWVEPAFDRTSGTAIDAFAKRFNREVEEEAKKLNTQLPRR